MIIEKEEPIESQYEAQMYAIGKAIDNTLKLSKSKTGFVVLMFPQNDINGRINYLSNSNRADMIIALKELIAALEGRKGEQPSATQ